MGWAGNLPEFSRVFPEKKSFRATSILEKAKREREKPREIAGLFSLPFLADGGSHHSHERQFECGEQPRQSMPSKCRVSASQLRKSTSGSSVVRQRAWGERSGRSQSLRCRRIFSMTQGLSMKLSIRKRPLHLGQVKGSARYTVWMRRALARLEKQWKSRFWPSSGYGAALGAGSGA